MDYSQWPWKVAIPSYNRADYITKATLSLCKYYNIPNEVIFIFIVDTEEQRKLYENAIDKVLYNGIHIIYGPLGLKNMRNFITNFFEEGTPLLCMDDDILSLHELYENNTITDKSKAAHWKLKDLTPESFLEWTIQAYTIMNNRKLSLFGIYPVKNGYFMKDLPEITYDARFCVGAFWGIINTKQTEMFITLDEKEDMERSILFTLKDGGVLRFNNITLSTKYYKTPGGMQTHQTNNDRKNSSIESAKMLYDKYPSLCTLYHGKKNGMCEIRFKKGLKL